MEEGQPRQVKHQKHPHPHHPHHVVPKHESGYTDEAAVECHDLIDRAEEEAHLHDPDSMYATEGIPSTGTSGTAKMGKKMMGGLEGSSSTGMASKKMGGLEGSSAGGAAEKMSQTGKNIKSTVGEKMGHMKDQMKDAMHMNK